MASASLDTFHLSSEKHCKAVLDLLQKGRQNLEYADIKIRAEGETATAHKFVLGTVSPFLKEVLTDSHAESIIILDDTSYDDLRLALQFIYNGEIYTSAKRGQRIGEVLQRLGISLNKKIDDVPSRDSSQNRAHSRTTNTPSSASLKLQPVVSLERLEEPPANIDSSAFSCQRCGKEYDLKWHLETHEMAGCNQYPVQCTECDDECSDFVELSLHRAYHSGKNKCPLCPTEFGKRCYLKMHFLNKHLPLQYLQSKCSYCPKAYYSNDRRVGHERFAHRTPSGTGATSMSQLSPSPGSKRGFICDTCQKWLPNRWLLESHIATTCESKFDPCTTCSEKLISFKDVVKHKAKHLVSNQCPICLQKLQSNIVLQMHIFSKHLPAEMLSLKCSLCDEKLFDVLTLNKHRKESHNENPLPISSPVFGQESSSSDHTREELSDAESANASKSKKQKLDIARAPSKDTLKSVQPNENGNCSSTSVSEGIVTDDKTFKCADCQQTFSRQDFVQHLKARAGCSVYNCFEQYSEKLNKCLSCGWKLAGRRVSDFLRHFQQTCLIPSECEEASDCTVCGVTLKKRHWSSHHRVNHGVAVDAAEKIEMETVKGDVQCRVCLSKFPDVLLRGHQRTCSYEKYFVEKEDSYECNRCLEKMPKGHRSLHILKCSREAAGVLQNVEPYQTAEFRCMVCRAPFTDRVLLCRHKIYCTNDLVFKKITSNTMECLLCGNICGRESTHKGHLRSCRRSLSIVSTEMQEDADSSSTATPQNADKLLHKCPICLTKFLRFHEALQHTKECTDKLFILSPDGRLICRYCDNVVVSRARHFEENVCPGGIEARERLILSACETAVGGIETGGQEVAAGVKVEPLELSAEDHPDAVERMDFEESFTYPVQEGAGLLFTRLGDIPLSSDRTDNEFAASSKIEVRPAAS